MNPAEWDVARKLAAVAVLPALLVGGAVANTSIVTVDVDTADGPHLALPVPLPLARAGLAFAPDEARRVEVPEVAEHVPQIRRVVEALRDAPDAVIVDVEDGEEHVSVAKEGDALRVHVVDGERTTADVRLPLGSADAVLRAYDAETRSFETSELVAAVGAAPAGELVRVVDGEDEVSVRIR